MLSYWLKTSGSSQKIKLFFLNKNNLYNFVQVELLLYLWENRDDQENEKDFFFDNIRVICENIYDLSDSSSVTQRFCLMIASLTAKLSNSFNQFFQENYDYIVQRKQLYSNCNHIALYLALLALQTDNSTIQRKDFFYYFIWSRYETINQLGKRIINTSIYRTIHQMDSITKVRNKDRKIAKIRKMELKVEK